LLSFLDDLLRLDPGFGELMLDLLTLVANVLERSRRRRSASPRAVLISC
jgi:hypothetical protein